MAVASMTAVPTNPSLHSVSTCLSPSPCRAAVACSIASVIQPGTAITTFSPQLSHGVLRCICATPGCEAIEAAVLVGRCLTIWCEVGGQGAADGEVDLRGGVEGRGT